MLTPDDSLENADWIKTLRWPFPEVRTADDLNEWLRAQGMTMEHFKSLPLYKAWLKWQTETEGAP